MNPTDTAPQIELRDPNDLRPHALIKPMPRWAKDTDEWQAFVADIRSRGITTALVILQDGTLIDGETRRRAAVGLKMVTVPCQVIPQDVAAQTILQHLLLRRNLGKGALAYVGYPLIEASHEEAKARALDCLKRGDAPGSHSVADGAKRVEDLAAQLGISLALFKQAARIREIFIEDPEFKDEMEPRILDTVDPVGLGAAIAGYAGRKATNGKAKGKRANEELSLFTDAWSGLGKRFGYWEKMDTDNRERSLGVIRKTVSAMPKDLLKVLKRAIKTAEKEAKATSAPVTA